jgi:hypothetical protein
MIWYTNYFYVEWQIAEKLTRAKHWYDGTSYRFIEAWRLFLSVLVHCLKIFRARGLRNAGGIRCQENYQCSNSLRNFNLLEDLFYSGMFKFRLNESKILRNKKCQLKLLR